MAETQTLYGLATWLVSMDEPGSTWRPIVTMQMIIDEAKLALDHDARLTHRLTQLQQGIEGEIEKCREIAEDVRWHPDIRSARQGEADRLEALLSESKEGER